MTWATMCVMFLVLWQVPGPAAPSTTTLPHEYVLPPSPRPHVSSHRYLQSLHTFQTLQRSDTSGERWRGPGLTGHTTGDEGNTNALYQPRLPDSLQGNNGSSSEYSRGRREIVNPRRAHMPLGRHGIPWHPVPHTSSHHHYPIRLLSSDYLHDIRAGTLMSPIKTRLRHKEFIRPERLESEISHNEKVMIVMAGEKQTFLKETSTDDHVSEKDNSSAATVEYKRGGDPQVVYTQRKNASELVERLGQSDDEVKEYILKVGEYTGGRHNATPIGASLLVYNRIPKCASSTMQTILRRLSRHLGFDHVSSLIYDKRQLTQEDREELVDNLTTSMNSTPSHTLSYDRHIYYTNFTELGMDRPVYINIIRDPVERFISSFYYRRSQERLNRIQSRGHRTTFSPNWVNRTVEQCVLYNDTECLFLPGEHKETIVTYFCGHHTFCRILGHKDALQVAKKVVAEEYSVVGLVKYMALSLHLMETLVPRYLTGALQIYENIRQREHIIVNKNQRKPEVPRATREELLRRMTDDVELYHFLLQRLYEQKKIFLSKQS
ncbi:heparan sulfate 2-O-sulfotransferase pipe isoform X2 [Procambarus clarkii]